MKYNQQPETTDHALITAVISAFRSITPSYTNAHTWYTKQHPTTSPLPQPIKSKYYIPIFGSVFASTFALIMILTSYNNQLPTGTVSLKNQTSTNPEVATFSSFSSQMHVSDDVAGAKEDRQLLAKIDAQSKATSRTQADESFTESLNVETSLQDLFE